MRAGDCLMRERGGEGVGANGDRGRRIGPWGSALEPADLLAFQEFQFSAQAGEGPEIAGDVDKNDRQERHDYDHG